MHPEQIIHFDTELIISGRLSQHCHAVIFVCCDRNAELLTDFARDVAGSFSFAGESAPRLHDCASADRELRRSDGQIPHCHEGHGVSILHGVEPGKGHSLVFSLGRSHNLTK